MSHAPRRGVRPPHDVPQTTPTRTTATNAITAAIPPFMLETPPHAPFVTTPVPPSNNPGNSIIPNERGHRSRHGRHSQNTPTANGQTEGPETEPPQNPSQQNGSTVSEAGHDEASLLESAAQEAHDAKQLVGLRDISSLATWTLSSSKPGCALQQLRHPSPSYFWQSDGPQPHTLTLHFFKLVAIVKMRIYLDFELDESYTPTKMRFFAGMSEGGLVEFGSWEAQESTDPESGEVRSGVEGIRGWIDVDLKGVGGRDVRYHEGIEQDARARRLRRKAARGQSPLKCGVEVDNDGDVDMEEPSYIGGDVLKAMVVQVRICENHQNGKDTHVRGFQVFARDETRTAPVRKKVRRAKVEEEEANQEEEQEEVIGLEPAEWMKDPEIR